MSLGICYWHDSSSSAGFHRERKGSVKKHECWEILLKQMRNFINIHFSIIECLYLSECLLLLYALWIRIQTMASKTFYQRFCLFVLRIFSPALFFFVHCSTFTLWVCWIQQRFMRAWTFHVFLSLLLSHQQLRWKNVRICLKLHFLW